MKLAGSVILLILFFNFSCSENSTTEPEPSFFEIQGPNGFVGTVNGTDAYVALLIGENDGIVYVCNGDEEISEWFKGAISDPTEISLTNTAGAQITAKFAGNSFSGEVTLSNDTTYSINATPNRSDGAGIYRVMGDDATRDEVEAGWILNSEEDQRGALRIQSRFRKAPKLKIGDITDGTSNTVLIGEKRFSFFHITR